MWFQDNNLSLNVSKTNSLITEHFKFLGVHLTNGLSWCPHTNTVVQRAQQNLYPLRRLKRLGMGPQILKQFYSCGRAAHRGGWG